MKEVLAFFIVLFLLSFAAILEVYENLSAEIEIQSIISSTSH